MKLDRNGYSKSLFDTEDGFCYIHKDYCQTVRHECLPGPCRPLSKKYGLWINVCPSCHNMSNDSIHANPDKYEYLKAKAQILFEQEYPDKSFLSVFGKKYI